MLHNLRKLREEAGISQKKLADAIGTSQQSINKYENHNVEPDIGTLVKLADYFNTSLDYLVGHTDIRRRVEETHTYELNQEESELINACRGLGPRQRQILGSIIRLLDGP